MIFTLMKRLPPFVLLIACIVLVQQHSIEFWQNKAGLSYLEAMHWSILLEAGSAWLITRRAWWQTILALALSLIVVSGPLYQVSNKLIVALNAPADAVETQAKLEALLINQVGQQAEALSTFNKNSETRAGWLNAINGANEQLNENQSELKAFYQSRLVAEEPTWVSAAVLAMQAISLIIFQLLIVFTTRTTFAPVTLTRKARKNTDSVKSPVAAGQENRKYKERLVKAVAANTRQVSAAS